MLSKKAARLFFLVGTAVCAGSFILLTVDTFQRIPDQTNREDLSESAIRGKHLWEENNCMGCHTLYGEGAYYAPELTKVYQRRGPEFIKAMLKDPQAMYPGQRKMQQYDFTEAEMDDLVEFFKWINEVDLNGFPADPPLAQTVRQVAAPAASTPEQASAPAPAAEANAAPAAPAVFDQMCTACHALGGAGGSVGPALDGVGSRLDAAYLSKWLQDPQAVKPGTTMPKLPLSETQVDELVTFLAANKE